MFQSTRPARGLFREIEETFGPIIVSIHARAEPRRKLCVTLRRLFGFNPRAPRGAATKSYCVLGYV